MLRIKGEKSTKSVEVALSLGSGGGGGMRGNIMEINLFVFSPEPSCRANTAPGQPPPPRQPPPPGRGSNQIEKIISIQYSYISVAGFRSEAGLLAAVISRDIIKAEAIKVLVSVYECMISV